MLEIINNLQPFFKDCYRRINVREYARLMKISPPTASKLLQSYVIEGLLKRNQDKLYIYYSANAANKTFIDLSRIYWQESLQQKGLLEYIAKEYKLAVIILFGSLAKAEVTQDSDIDIAIFSPSKHKIDVSNFEKKLKRKIQLLIYSSPDETKNKELLKNIYSGYILKGEW